MRCEDCDGVGYFMDYDTDNAIPPRKIITQKKCATCDGTGEVPEEETDKESKTDFHNPT